MKKYIFCLLLNLIFTYNYTQNYYLPTPQGYGANTTGGGNASAVTVTTFAELKSNLTAAGAKVILVAGTITIPSGQAISAVVTNKSLIGLPGATLINDNQTSGAGILYLKPGSNNVIIRNLIFKGPGAYDIDGKDNLTADGALNLWVDHCEFQDGQDGNFDIKGKSDNVSVSWCKFTYLKPPVAGGSGGSNDHRFSNLVGSSATDFPEDGKYSITFQNNYWAEGVKGRMPRARNAELHIISCFYNTSVAGATGIGLGGGANNSTCYVQNTNFKKVATVFSPAPGDGGTVAINYVNSLRSPSDLGTVLAPTYVTTPIPVEDVERILTDATCGAGATLQVSASGLITPSICTGLGVKNASGAAGRKLDCTPTANHELQIKFPAANFGNTTFQVFSITGQLLLTKNKILKSASATLDVNQLQSGIYVLSARNEQDSLRCKFYRN